MIDASMLVFLSSEHLIEKVCRLDCGFITTDFVMQEIRGLDGLMVSTAEMLKEHVSVVSFDSDGMSRLQDFFCMQLKATNSTFQDCSAWMYASENGYGLLTGNAKIKECAVEMGMEAHAFPFILDMMAKAGLMEPADAAVRIMNVLSSSHHLSSIIDRNGFRYTNWLNENYLYGNMNMGRTKSPRAICR